MRGEERRGKVSGGKAREKREGRGWEKREEEIGEEVRGEGVIKTISTFTSKTSTKLYSEYKMKHLHNYTTIPPTQTRSVLTIHLPHSTPTHINVHVLQVLREHSGNHTNEKDTLPPQVSAPLQLRHSCKAPKRIRDHTHTHWISQIQWYMYVLTKLHLRSLCR